MVICASTMFAQEDDYVTAFENLKSNYNTEKYDEIFNSFSLDMQKFFPLENTKQFFTNLKGQAGKILDEEYINDQDGTGAFYKTQFERALLGVYITLNNQNEIISFLIKAYEEPKSFKVAELNALNNYPAEVAELIFAKAKTLPNNAQLSIAITNNGKTNYYGVSRDGSSIKPIDNSDKVFEICSITKVFTSTVLASLVEDKKIKLDDEINSVYSFDFKDDIKITFESLANHTSGMTRLPENLDLSNTANPYESYGVNELEDYLKNLLTLNDDPSKPYTYSNLGAGLLGNTLGVSQKSTFQDLLQTNVFDKYDMQNSFMSSSNLGNQLVKGLDEKGNVVSNWDFDVMFGGGGILSTTEDLSKFAKAQFIPANKELELTRKVTFDINENLRIGLGWHILKSDSGNDLYWHNGGTGGYSSSMTIDLENETAVIILSNVADINNLIDTLGMELLRYSVK